MNKLQFTLALAAIVAVGSLFMDDEARKNNRCIYRMNGPQLEETIFLINHLNSPMPWEQVQDW